MKRFLKLMFILALMSVSGRALAQQQFQGLCARVKMVIVQELTIERIGFEATLELTNNDGEDPMTDFFADLTFENPLLSSNNVPNDASTLFFVRAPTLENINDVNGGGIIGPTRTATVRWFIIPKILAGGTSPNGIRYKVGARLSAKFKGQQLPAEVLTVFPDTIYVKPEAQLEITYFQPRDVQGDDPFTTEIVESPIPFTLGVLVKNSGYGVARKLKINSQQPTIVENLRHLLIVAQLLGARVMDSPRNANLVVDLGDINPGETRKGAWDMITSLSGEFTEFKASYTHASELGGEETSVIKSLDAHFIAHEVLNDQPGRDHIKDFLADTDRDENILPDALYESQGNVLPVNYLQFATNSVSGAVGSGGTFDVDLLADKASWGYMRLTDPGQARLRIASIVRSDGKVLNTNNFWTNIRYTRGSNARQNYLNILDLVELGSYRYTVTYGAGDVDITPPVTTLHFAGSATPIGDRTYITPETEIFFVSEDNSPVSIVYSLTNGPFRPALPFTIPVAGEYPIVYYATDSSNNREDNHTNILVILPDAPAIANASISSQPLFVPGDTLSIRPDHADFTFQAQPNPTRLDAIVDVFQGVAGWATVRGVPSSPTASSSAALQVGGVFVDYYKYKLDTGTWSAETPIAQDIALSGLAAGQHTVSVIGRSQFGDYLDVSNAVQVAWEVRAGAPSTIVSGTPETPTRLNNATLAISGAGMTHYRWTIDNGFYRAETGVTNPVPLSALSKGQHTVAVIGKVAGTYQPTNDATKVSWTVDPDYGSDFSALARVRTALYTNINGQAITFAWNGRNDSGVVMPPGWYTVRLRIYDELGRTNFTTRLVQIGNLTSSATDLAGVARGPRNPHARGSWAVWQDQSQGNWNIYAQQVAPALGAITPVTSSLLNQENPRTDGRYVVWQARQVNGNWDIFIKDLTTGAAAQAITTTPALDEINPVIDWPWVVYQSKSSSAPTAPWQLRARNLATGENSIVSPSTRDQLDPEVQGGRVVWQDHRDLGQGEIYFRNLESGEALRLTTNVFGQYHPAIMNNWIVWQDNRHIQVELYGFDLLRQREIRITDTPEDEAMPYLDGPWAVCEETSLGAVTANVRLIHLPSLRAVPLTRSPSLKARPALAGNRAVWLETENNLSHVVSVDMPALQAVFQNQNAIAVTEAMAAYLQNAHGLLNAWHAMGVQEITAYTTFVPQVTSETASWNGTQPVGPNFNLVPGTFLWVRFDQRRVLDLGINTGGALTLGPGVNAFSYTQFPSSYSAFELLRQLGTNNARAVRMLDSESGRWTVAQVVDQKLVGQDFYIPRVAVLMLDMTAPVSNFVPH